MPKLSFIPGAARAAVCARVPLAWLLTSFILTAFPSAADAADVDANGIDDPVEVQLAKKFQPAFILHSGRIVEPEPVEIMNDPSGTALQPEDVFLKAYNVAGQSIFSGPYCDWTNNIMCQENDRLHLVKSGSVIDGGIWQYWLAHFDYGGAGNENPTGWQNTYLYGNSVVQPADQYDPKIYAHFYTPGSDVYIQYWFFYPYNDFVNNHEGDWEHITLRLTSADPATAQITEAYYFQHENYIQLTGFYLSQAHVVDQTHLVVFVGGWGSYSCLGETGSGNTSGASYPSPGIFSDVLPFDLCGPADETISFGGKFLHYLDVDLEVLPDFPAPGTPQWTIDHHDWFMAHPSTQWMMADTKWGYPFSDTPWLAWSSVPFADLIAWIGGASIYNVGQLAPRTPRYKPDWDSVTGNAQSYAGWVSNLLNSPTLSYVAMEAGGQLIANQQFTFTPTGQGTVSHSNPDYLILVEGEIEVPASTQLGGNYYVFETWEDGSSNPIRSVVPTGQPQSFTAHYINCGNAPGITFPVGGETLFTDQTITVTWADCAAYTYTSHTVSYSSDGGQTYTVLASVAGGAQSATVTIPAGISDHGKIRIESLRASGAMVVHESGEFVVTVGMLDETPVFLKFEDVNGISWPDYNNDGNLDLCMTVDQPGLWLGDVIVFDGNGNGSFTQVTGIFWVTSPKGHAWGDYNNDGLLDLYVGSDGSANRLFKNLGTGSFTTVSAPLIEDTGQARGVSWVDYDGTGRPDLFVANYNGPNKLLRNAGAGVWVDDSNLIAGIQAHNSNAGVWADYDKDGDQDLYVANWGAPDQLFRNDGGSFYEKPMFPMGNYQSRGADWVDYDNDGDLDIFVVTALGPELLWVNQGDGSFVFTTSHGMNGTTTEHDFMATWRDVANFGWLDPYIVSGDEDRRYTNLGFNGQGVSFLDLGTSWHGDDFGRSGMAADYDNDGRMDLFFADTKNNAPTTWLLRNYVDYGGAHWLEFDLVGTEGSKDAVGAIVEVTIEPGGFGAYTMTRHVSGGSGYLSQPPRRLHFGLASSTEADVVVRWPSGQVESFHQSSVDQIVTLVEPDIPNPGGTGCPYVYVNDGDGYVEQNTVLARVDESEAGRKEADVRDSFILATPPAEVLGEYLVEIREFEREHTYLDYAGLFAFDHPFGSTLAVDAEGGFYLRDDELAKPVSAVDASGRSVLRLLLEDDGERFDGEPGDVVTLRFDAAEISPGRPLVARSVQKDQEQPQIPRASHETGIAVARRLEGDDEFEVIGTIHPRELASDQSIGVDETLGTLRAPDGGIVEIRLTWHTEHELDRIGWSKPFDGTMAAHVLPLRRAGWMKDGGTGPTRSVDVTDAVGATDLDYAELLPGERIALVFDAVPEAKTRRTFVLDLEGHYVRLDASTAAPTVYGLVDNSPNPFNPHTTISFSLPTRTELSLRVYGPDGRLIRSLAEGSWTAGDHAVTWDGRDDAGREAGSGVYFYTLDSEFGTKTRKMILLR